MILVLNFELFGDDQTPRQRVAFQEIDVHRYQWKGFSLYFQAALLYNSLTLKR
jgi:hypothetical protein